MAGITVHPAQRAGAAQLLDETIEVASGPPSPKRDGYRLWLTTPSEGRRAVLGHAGVSAQDWERRMAPVVASWWNWPHS